MVGLMLGMLSGVTARAVVVAEKAVNKREIPCGAARRR
jgi:hypothetical protein